MTQREEESNEVSMSTKCRPGGNSCCGAGEREATCTSASRPAYAQLSQPGIETLGVVHQPAQTLVCDLTS